MRRARAKAAAASSRRPGLVPTEQRLSARYAVPLARMARLFLAGLAGFGAALEIGALGLERTAPYGQVADFGMGLAFGMLMVGVLLTSRRAAAIRAAKIRLLQKAGLRCGDEETSS